MDIQRILEDFKGVRNIPGIKSTKKRALTKIKNDKGECINLDKNDVFGETRTTRKMILNMNWVMMTTTAAQTCTTTTPKRRQESQRLRQKSCKPQSTNSKYPTESKGIRAEYSKVCDDETREMVRQIFNDIIKKNEFTPEDWKKVTIKVIHNKGDVDNVSNYRSICSLLALYKLFSTILLNRKSGRSGWLQKILPDNRPLCNVQID